jgi:hypothetical protein
MSPTWHNYYDFYLDGKPISAAAAAASDDGEAKGPPTKGKARKQKKP